MTPDSPIRVVVVDDEPLARRGVGRLVARDVHFQVVAEAESVPAALEAIQRHRPELVFLDVSMPEADGFALLEQLPLAQQPAVVFVTASREHSLRALAAHAFDYILKPIDPLRFAATLTDFRASRHKQVAPPPPEAEILVTLPPGDLFREQLTIPEGHGLRKIELAEVIWISAAENYVELHYHSRRVLWRQTMQKATTLLDARQFMRIHRSAIIRTAHLSRLRPIGRGIFEITLSNGTVLLSGRRYRETIRAWLEANRKP